MTKAKSYLKYIFIAGIIFGIFFGVGSALSHIFYAERNGGPDTATEQEGIDPLGKRQDGKRTKILLLGVDARPGEKNARSDTMILLTIDPQLDKAAVVSIPRDTKIELQGGGTEKICAVNYLGGPKGAVEAVEKLMDTKIDHYVEMDFNGFKEIVDILGGVTLNVPQRMYKPTEDIDLYPGTQKLNGRQALAFVRFRDYITGDIQRTAAQQEFLKALAGEMLKPKTLTKLPSLLRQLDKSVDTNLKKSDILRLASWAPGFSSDSIISQTLPGYFYDERDEYGHLICSYWIADKKSLPKLLDNMLAGETVAVVQGVTSNQRKVAATKGNKEEEEGEDSEEGNNSDGTKYRDRDIERSQLPSPGHGEDRVLVQSYSGSPGISYPTSDASGPAGYI